MGMSHVNKMWGKSDGQKKGPTTQSQHQSSVSMPTHNTGGNSKRPTESESSKANMMTPKYQSKGLSPIDGTGRGKMKIG
jgi:hypothetical protein